MNNSKIQTLHPEKGKLNQKIPVEKYEVIKTAILKVLKAKELTHTELINQLEKELKGKFTDNVNWYGITVKLDLEARHLIQRSKKSPVLYSLVK